MKKIIPVFFLFLSTVCHAQSDNIDSLLRVLKSAKEDTGKVNLLKSIGVFYANEDPAKAIEYWKQGVLLSRELNYTVGLARNFINIGTGYSYLGKFDTTIIYIDSAIIYTKKTKDPDRLALVYLNKGDAYRNLGDFKSALLYCDTASMYAAQTGNTDRRARIYDIISGLYMDQRLFTNAFIFLNKALELYKKDNNAIMEGQVYDDFGIIYQQKGKLDSALIFRKMAIHIADSVKDYKNLSTYYNGVASIYTDLENYKDAEVYAARSLAYAQQQENNIQLANTYSLLAKIFIKKKNFDEAIKAGNTAYQFAMNEAQISGQEEAAALLAEAYTATGDYKNANHFLSISSALKDSLTQQTFNGQVAGLQSSFELKEKDRAILILNKDKELQQQKLQQQKLLLFGAVIIVLITLVSVWLLLNRNKLKQHMKELVLRGKIAADLHDEVGSTLSSIRMYSDIVKKQSQLSHASSELLDKISSNSKEMIENMSDIVWMIKPGNDDFKSIESRMLNFANDICGPAAINFEFTTDKAADVIKMPMEMRRDIYLIFKEAVNNAVKYSGCKNIHSNISFMQDELQLRIEDDGNGFDFDVAKKGNGLSNMQKRTEDNKGIFKIKSSPGEGTQVLIYFKT